MRPPKYKIGEMVSFGYNGDQLRGNIIDCTDVPDDVTFRYIYTIKVTGFFITNKYKVYEDSLIHIDLDVLVGL